MKKLLIASIIGLSTFGAYAQYPHHNHRYGGLGYNWVAPAIIGGVVTYELTRPPQTVIVQPQYTVNGQYCSPWTEIRNPDGSTTFTRTCQ